MQELVCKKCGYAWQYKGDKQRTSCSKCKTSLTLKKDDTPPRPIHTHTSSEAITPIPIAISKKHEKIFIPLPLADQLNKFLLAKFIGLAKSMGDKRIEFNVNEEGEIYISQ